MLKLLDAAAEVGPTLAALVDSVEKRASND
jgi:hypothetical protein